MKWSMFFPVVFFSLCTTPFALDQITIEGFGSGIARGDALIAAKKNAASNAIKTVLTSQVEIDSFTAKENSCISKTMGAIKDWEVLSEAKTSDSLYEIKIKTAISKSSVLKELVSLQILIESMNKPRILVLVSEENCGSWEPQNNSAENAVHNFLNDPYKFDLISPAIAASIKESKQRIVQLTSNLSSAVATGTQNGAEVLITGTAVSRKSEIYNSHNPNGMVSVDADITLRAINCTTGRLICSESGHSSAAEMSHLTAGNIAIEKAATNTIKNLLDPIIKDWQGQLNTGISINLNIGEVNTFRQKNVILQTISRMANLSTTREQLWDPESGLLEIIVYYKGNPTEFHRRIDGYKLVSGGGSLLVTGINGQNITLVAQAM